jgi:hypothetical protein
MIIMPKVNYVEAKVKASALATFVVTLVGTTWLATTATDFVPQLPDLLEAPAYAVIAAGISFLAGYRKSNVEGRLSPSTLEAAEAWIRKHNPRG